MNSDEKLNKEPTNRPSLLCSVSYSDMHYIRAVLRCACQIPVNCDSLYIHACKGISFKPVVTRDLFSDLMSSAVCIHLVYDKQEPLRIYIFYIALTQLPM